MKNLRFLIIVIVAIAIGNYLSAFVLNIGGQPIQFRSFIPNIVVPAESLNGTGGWLTNTLFTTFIVDAVIIVLALLARAGIRTDGAKPGNWFANAWESFVDLLYRNYMVPTLGSRAKVVAPIAISAFVFILISAMFELVPGVESIGKVEAPHAPLKGWCGAQIGGVTLITGVPVDPAVGYEASCGRPVIGGAEGETPTTEATSQEHATEAAGTDTAAATTEVHAAGPNEAGYAIIPFLRRPTSSLSTTIALALIAFLFIEIQGVRANGAHYFSRFFQVHSLEQGRRGMMAGMIGNINVIVGILELISELIRIVSFAFRLFGNMFAGTVLVLVMSSILPTFLPTVFLALEFGVGVIQAFVFLMLITVFTSLATAHGEH